MFFFSFKIRSPRGVRSISQRRHTGGILAPADLDELVFAGLRQSIALHVRKFHCEMYLLDIADFLGHFDGCVGRVPVLESRESGWCCSRRRRWAVVEKDFW